MSLEITPPAERPRNDIGAVHRLSERAFVSRHRMGRAPLVHPVGPALVENAGGIAKDGVFMGEAHGLDETDDRERRRARARYRRP